MLDTLELATAALDFDVQVSFRFCSFLLFWDGKGDVSLTFPNSVDLVLFASKASNRPSARPEPKLIPERSQSILEDILFRRISFNIGLCT